MSQTKEIENREEYNHSSGELKLKVIGANADLTSITIYQNSSMIGNGEGEVEKKTQAAEGDEIYIRARIDKLDRSDFATLDIELEGTSGEHYYTYSEALPNYDVVYYHTRIKLKP